ncbi:hypothetical protein CTA2_879 [Colletotrichum tanaceti]|uniref:Methyltransferase domain-containing protein n=1 Tax=Colletotrichum tanaceti TaxID=1306861 RepID=A0A4U6X3Q1_9PEZI|nr:hypothetical protein CTA2_879 [Colletotrichum tanaceti]TKW49399.1 hypothetical protein CTA1_10811 [Colletotrichum tanaceti]
MPFYNCPWDVERIGRMGDGGKWVCGMSRYENYYPKDPGCIIYSLGVRDESSFGVAEPYQLCDLGLLSRAGAAQSGRVADG